RFRLWHCRLSLLSLLAGVILIAIVPQIHDLFLERLSGSAIMAYAAILLLFWAVPIHLAARRAISHIVINDHPCSRKAAAQIDLWLRRLLGAVPLLVIFLGISFSGEQLQGLSNLPEAKDAADGLAGLRWAVAGAMIFYAGYILLRHIIAGAGSGQPP